MKKTISLALATLLLVFAFSSAACAAFANGSQAIVSTRSGKLNMRSGASGAYPIIDRLANGTTVTIVSQSGNWYCVSVGGRTGYVSADYLRANPNDPGSTELTPGTVPGTNNNPAQTVLGAKAYVSTSGGSLNMRVSPSAAGGVVRRLPNGAQVTVQEKVGDWYRVSYGSSQGYVMGSYLRVTQTGGSTGGNTTPGGTTGGNTTTGGSVAYVNTTSGSLNMRDAAGGRVIAQIARGTQVTVLSQTGRWSRIIANGQTGYVMTSYLSSSMPGAQNPGGSQSNISARVTSAQYLRLQPEDTASPVTQLGANAVVTVRNYGVEWCYVSFGGYTGYVRTSALNFANQGGAATQPTVTSRTSVNYTAYAQTDVSLLRIYPDAGADVSRSTTANITRNALVTVTQRATTSDNVVWLYIQTGYTTGWIRQGDLALRAADGSTVLPGASGGGSTAYVNTSGGSLNMRASIGGSVIAQLPRGTQVTVISQTNGWSYISVNGRNGYVSSRYLSSTNGSSGSTGGAGGMGALNSSLDNMPAYTNSAQYLRSEPEQQFELHHQHPQRREPDHPHLRLQLVPRRLRRPERLYPDQLHALRPAGRRHGLRHAGRDRYQHRERQLHRLRRAGQRPAAHLRRTGGQLLRVRQHRGQHGRAGDAARDDERQPRLAEDFDQRRFRLDSSGRSCAEQHEPGRGRRFRQHDRAAHRLRRDGSKTPARAPARATRPQACSTGSTVSRAEPVPAMARA